MRYDTSRKALYQPESKPVFVDVDRMPRFEFDNFAFSLVNAWWLSNASHLAYYEPNLLEHELHKAGLRLVDYFAAKSTQAYLAASDSFAILAFRGTESDEFTDLKVDADIHLTRWRDGARVHRGFSTALDEVWEKVDQSVQALTAHDLSIWYTGHSLGAALATLAATRRKPDALFTFGSPRVGNADLARLLDRVPTQRIVNCSDMAATLPARILGYRHVGELVFFTAGARPLLNPSSTRVFFSQTAGMIKYFAALPWFRRGMVAARPFADHAIVNYTAALVRALSLRPTIPRD